MPQFPLCSEFIPLLDTVKNQLAELKNLSQEFLRSGTSAQEELIKTKSQELENTKQQFINLAEQPVEFEGNTVVRIEKELLTFLRNKLDRDLTYSIKENRVIMISISSGSEKSAEILESVLKFVRLFSQLQWFYCQNTQIINLPELPDSLEYLDCYDTQITTLPKLPQNLQWLGCSNTQITTLPELPQSLRRLGCANTQIDSLPDKLPDSLRNLNCSSTPASKNPKTIKQFEEFKKNHPQFEYTI